MLRFTLAGLLVCLSLGVAQSDEVPRKDRDVIQGAWRIVRFTSEGEELDKDLFADTVLTFDGETARLKIIGIELDGTFTLRDREVPKVIDSEMSFVNGIYKLEGDRLTICSSVKTGGKRPSEFSSTRENGFDLVVLERIRP